MKKLILLSLSLLFTACHLTKPSVGECYIYDGKTFKVKAVGDLSVIIVHEAKQIQTIAMALKTFSSLKEMDLINQVDCWE